MKNWKQFIAICLAYALLTVGACLSVPAHAGMSMTPGTPVHTHSDANTGGGSLALSGTLSSTKACTAGYMRVGANYCSADSSTLTIKWTMAGGAICTQSQSLGFTNANAVLIGTVSTFASTNAIGLYTNTTSFYTWNDSSCLFVVENFLITDREWVALAANTIFGIIPAPTFVLHTNTAGQFYYKAATGNAQANTSNAYYVFGYFD